MVKVDHGWQERAPKPHLPDTSKTSWRLSEASVVYADKLSKAEKRIAELEGALRPFAQVWAGPSACTTHKGSKLGVCKDLGVEPICDTCRARKVLND